MVALVSMVGCHLIGGVTDLEFVDGQGVRASLWVTGR